MLQLIWFGFSLFVFYVTCTVAAETGTTLFFSILNASKASSTLGFLSRPFLVCSYLPKRLRVKSGEEEMDCEMV